MRFPIDIESCKGIPINYHPGAFGFNRKGYLHTGVDLYCGEYEPVYAIESGVVVGKGVFTGESVGTPWWEETYYLMVEGEIGVFNYGEIYNSVLEVGTEVRAGAFIGYIKRVLFEDKFRADVPHHSTSMLHLELYKHGIKEPLAWHGPNKPESLLDPTPYLLDMYYTNFETMRDNLKSFLWENVM